MDYVGGGRRSGYCPAASALRVYADCGGTVAGGDAAAGGKVSGGGVLQGWSARSPGASDRRPGRHGTLPVRGVSVRAGGRRAGWMGPGAYA